ncbi:hypothetical protein ACKS9G_004382, partial [Cronobacter turicensis]
VSVGAKSCITQRSDRIILMINVEYIKATFHLYQDEDDYPPVNYESVCLKINNEGDYELNSIAFYVYGVSKGEVLAFQKTKMSLSQAVF